MADAPSFYDKVLHLADEMKLEGDERDTFINQSMEKHGGHKKVTTWVVDDGKGDGDKKTPGWF